MKTATQLVILVLSTFHLSAATLYVSLVSTNPVPPFINWATAATNIQDAVDAATVGDTVFVTNGVYAVGGKTNDWGNENRVTITNVIRLESVNGPLVTIIDGVGSVRCAYLCSNAVLSGFTLTNGFAYRGGGVFCEDPSAVVTNCVMTGNSAHYRIIGDGADGGGGANGGTLYNCTLTGNSGGGALDSTLYNCTLTGNEAMDGGGASGSTLYNCTLVGNSGCRGGGAYWSALYGCTLSGNSSYCILGGGTDLSILYNCTVSGNSGRGAVGSTLYNCTVTGNDGGGVGRDGYGVGSILFNSIVFYNYGGNYDEGTALNHCCTTPFPTNGVGSITGHPLFMDMAEGDYRLREESPCIDAGTNLMGFPMTEYRYVPEIGDYDWVVVGHVTDPTDILGNTRFIDGNFDGTVAWDIGAYEFNSFPPPRFTCAPRLLPDCCRLSITGATNRWVRVQRSIDLRNWEDSWDNHGGFFEIVIFMGTEGVKQVVDTASSQSRMFYRVVVE